MEGLKDIHSSIIKTTIKNKVFKKGTIDTLKVVTIDSIELFKSTKKCYNKCFTRVDKNGTTHYFYRAIICATVRTAPHLILGQEMLEPNRDGPDKDEGEITGGKLLINNLYKESLKSVLFVKKIDLIIMIII